MAGAIGGDNIGEVVGPGAGIEARARFPINLRYPRGWRDTPQRLADLPLLTPSGAQTTLGSVARIRISDGPAMLKSENARPTGWVYIDVQGRDLAAVVADLRSAVAAQVTLEPGLAVAYSGQFESLERANARLLLVLPATLGLIFVLLVLTFGRAGEALLILGTLHFALIGGVWLLYALGYHLSVATGVGFIALAGVAAEFGVVMLVYLNQALDQARAGLTEGQTLTPAQVDDAIRQGAVQRVRPKAMTVAVILAGLVPVVWGDGAGSELMSRIAAPMLGGMLSAPLLSLLVVPAVVALRWRAPRTAPP